MILSLLFSFRVVLSSLMEQIGCQRDGQDPAAQEATEFSRDSCTTRGVKKTPPCLPVSQNATQGVSGGQNPGETPHAKCGSVGVSALFLTNHTLRYRDRGALAYGNCSPLSEFP